MTSILIIYTGGTIGMVKDVHSGTLVPFNFDHIKEQVPELKRISSQIDTIAFDPLIDSSDVEPGMWYNIAELIFKNYNSYDGFVVLHGTDTMAWSASAVSFILENLDKPVIFTGSQLPISVLRTDGRDNLLTAIEIAGAKKDGKPVVPEVSIYFENRLLRGNRTTKYSTEQFNAFESPNLQPLAIAGIEIVYNSENILYPTVRQDIRIANPPDPRVAILKLFPGITQENVIAVSGIKGLKGLIIESFGSGNAPSASWFTETIEKFTSAGGIALNISQCQKGPVMPGIYETGRWMERAGVISGRDLTSEAAVAKMMYLAGNYDNMETINKLLSTPLRGEITV